jgi:4a-hydroxytetrahydrobiopterin dehydratase
MDRAPLPVDELQALLAHLPGWRREGPALLRDLRFDDFAAAFAFMRLVALDAEELDHHPDWSNSWNKVSIALTTHSARCLTRLDAELARRIERRALESGAHAMP